MYGPDQKIIILVNSGQYFGKQLKQFDFAGVNNVTIKEKKQFTALINIYFGEK